MTLQLTPRQSRVVALLLLIASLALVVAAIAVPAWRLHQHYDRHIEEYSDHLARYRRVAAMRPAIDAALKDSQARNPQQFYLKASSPTLAAAELQGIATRIVEAQNGRIVSSQVLPQKEDGKVALSLNMSAGIIPLQLILHALETHQPSLFVNQMTVRANQGRAYKPTPGIQPEFVVQLTISAFMTGAAKP